MKVSPNDLTDEAQQLAGFILEGRTSQLLESEQLDHETYSGTSITSHPVGLLGKTAVRVDDFVEAPESGDVHDGPSGDAVSLLYNRNGELVSVKDIPVGYDALWGFNTLASSIVPSRRKIKQEELRLKAEKLIRASANILISHQ